jgi:hypothetical protein
MGHLDSLAIILEGLGTEFLEVTSKEGINHGFV